MKLIHIVKRRFSFLIDYLLHTGSDTSGLALTCTLGICIGIFPFPGTTTLLLTIIALLLGLNLPAIQVVNYAVYPLQLLLLYPYYAGGAAIFKIVLPYGSSNEILNALQHHPLDLIADVGGIAAGAFAIWLISAIPGSIVLYYFFRSLFGRKKQEQNL